MTFNTIADIEKRLNELPHFSLSQIARNVGVARFYVMRNNELSVAILAIAKGEVVPLHPQKKKAIRGLKLGNNYTKKEIDIVIEQNRHGRSGEAVSTITGTERKQKGGLGELTTQRSVGDIQRQMQQLNRQAEYAHRGLDYDSERIRDEQRERAEKNAVDRNVGDRRNQGLARGNTQSEQSGSDGNKSGKKRTITALENELRKTIAVQSDAVFAEVKKELNESKKLLETTREELRVQSGFRKFLFWATPVLLLAQTIAIIFTAL